MVQESEVPVMCLVFLHSLCTQLAFVSSYKKVEGKFNDSESLRMTIFRKPLKSKKVTNVILKHEHNDPMIGFSSSETERITASQNEVQLDTMVTKEPPIPLVQ